MIESVIIPQEVIIVEMPLTRKTIKLDKRAIGGISLHPSYDVTIKDGFTADVRVKQAYSHTKDDIAILIFYGGGSKRG